MAARDCPPAKILNPATNRCVLVNGQIGRRILREQAREAEANKARGPACPPGKIYNVQTDRCVNVRGAPGRRVFQQVKAYLDPRNPMLTLLPPELVLEIWGASYERPKNCGRLVMDLKNMDVSANKTILQRSVVKTVQQVQRILRMGHYTKYARLLNHGKEAMSILDVTSQILQIAKRRNVTIDQLVGYCRQVVAIKRRVAALVEQLQTSLRLAEDYLRTGTLPDSFMGDVYIGSYDLPRIRRLRHSHPLDVVIIRRLIASFRSRLAKDQKVLAMLRKPIDIRK